MSSQLMNLGTSISAMLVNGRFFAVPDLHDTGVMA